jgi:hypothetical protein
MRCGAGPRLDGRGHGELRRGGPCAERWGMVEQLERQVRWRIEWWKGRLADGVVVVVLWLLAWRQDGIRV